MVITLCAYAQQGYAFDRVCLYIHVYIYICIFVYVHVCQQKNKLFSALPLENLLLNVIYCLFFKFKRLQCGLLHLASCTDRVIHAFPNKTCRPPGPEIFSSEL